MLFFYVLVMMIYTTKQKQKSDANKCKMESKLYLECRMAKELMASQPLAELGFKEDQKEDERYKEEEDKESTKEENERNGFVAGARRARQQQKELTEEAYRQRHGR